MSSAIDGERHSPKQTDRHARRRSVWARTGAAMAAAVLLGLLALAPSAAASGSAQGPPVGPTTPPFTQCPAIGADTSCQFLVVVTNTNPKSAPEILEDSSQPYYDEIDDTTVAVQNESSSPLSSIHLGVKGSGDDPFGFDGDGLCQPLIGSPAEGCPFGVPSSENESWSYQGPDTEFVSDPETDEAGTVVFPTPLQPGQYTYFTLEAELGSPYLVGGEVNDAIASALTDTASSEVVPSPVIAIPAPANVTDQATIKGVNAAFATGKVTYRLYSDSSCKTEVFNSPVEIKTAGEVPPSAPVGAELPTNAKYYWVVEYSGNATPNENSKTTSYCGSEVMTFGTPPTPTIATVLSGGGKTGASITVPPGTAVTDTAAVIAPGGQPVNGRLIYGIYTESGCSSFSRIKGGGEVTTAGSGPASSPVTLPTGTYYFQVSYSGNGTLSRAVSPCGSEVLTVATPPPPPPPPASNSSFTIRSIVGSANGTVSITFVPTQSGEATLDVTVPTASIASVSATDARARRCRHGQVKIRRRCLPSTTTAGKASASGTAGVPVTLTVYLSGRIKAQLKRGRTVHLTATLTYKSSLGGTADVAIYDITVKGKRTRHRHGRR